MWLVIDKTSAENHSQRSTEKPLSITQNRTEIYMRMRKVKRSEENVACHRQDFRRKP
eukprot:c4081_g1_i1 orf=137-307(-)